MRVCSSFFSLITKPFKSQPEPNDIESANAPQRSPKHNTAFTNSSATSRLRIQEGNALLITFALCFACASVAHFASLLQYSTTGDIACGEQVLVDAISFR